VKKKLTYYEFFAGGGLVRAALGGNWTCLFANDICDKKAASYRKNWGRKELTVSDVADIDGNQLPGSSNLAWASFPCQDFSLAGNGAGLSGSRSSTFWPFMNLMAKLKNTGRAPQIIALENVLGTLSSNGGSDYRVIMRSLCDLGYKVGSVVIDASLFVPQSRKRLFMIAVRDDFRIPDCHTNSPDVRWHPLSLQSCYSKLEDNYQSKWVWWSVPKPKPRKLKLVDILEDDNSVLKWDTQAQTNALLGMMNTRHFERVSTAVKATNRQAGALYKRIRVEDGQRYQRAEVRFDGLAGCLRTPKGGASVQSILVTHNGAIKSRRLTEREAARLMGLRESYKLPESYTEAYHLMGDGVAVPVVRHLRRYIFEPILKLNDIKDIDGSISEKASMEQIDRLALVN